MIGQILYGFGVNTPVETNVLDQVSYGPGLTLTGTHECSGLVPPQPTGTVMPAGETGIAMAALQNMVAESVSFQTAIGAAGDAATKKLWALSRTRLVEYPNNEAFESEGGFARPFALITAPGGDRGQSIAEGSFGYNGELELWIEQMVPVAYQAAAQEANAEMYFKNFVDAVLCDIKALSSQPGYLMISRFTRPDGPGMVDTKIDGVVAFGEVISISWGLQ